MMLRYESVLKLVENLSGDESASKRVGISHYDDIELYTVSMKELPNLIGAACISVKNPNKPAPFHAPIF